MENHEIINNRTSPSCTEQLSAERYCGGEQNNHNEFVAKNYTIRYLQRIRNFGKKSIDWMLEQLKEKAGVEIE